MKFVVKRTIQGFATLFLPVIILIVLLINAPAWGFGLIGVVILSVFSFVAGVDMYGTDDE